MAMERMVMQPLIQARGNAHGRVVTCLHQYTSTTIRQRTLIRNPRHSITTLQGRDGARIGDVKGASRIPVGRSQSNVRALALCSGRGLAPPEAVCRYSTAASLKQDPFSDPRYQYPHQRQYRPQQQQRQTPSSPPPPSSAPTPAASTTSIRTIDLDNAIVSQAPVELSTEQRFLLEQVINKKKSVFFTGSAGTGKSVLLRQLIEELKGQYKPGQVAVTASTGIAACNIGGCTLHSFAGVGPGTGTAEQLIARLDGNKWARSRWRKVKVLIIDEISMIDGELFDKLEQIARKIKRSEKPFGGIQLIITGDFFQLPPVAKSAFGIDEVSGPTYTSAIPPRMRGSQSTTTIIKRASTNKSEDPLQDDIPFFDDDLGSYHAPPLLPDNTLGSSTPGSSLPAPTQPSLCFDAQTWNSCIEYTLQLTEVFRQRDPAFITMLTEMRHGKLSDETCQVFKELERTPSYPDDGIQATELFALRRQVDHANHRHLASLPGPMYVYEPQDDGPLKEFMDRACTAPSKLQLKENAQVMLIKNLTPTLVNGSMGLVVGFQEDMSYDPDTGSVTKSHFPVVRFQGEEDDLVVKPEEWRMELPDGEVMASRIQVPLILAWAMSIHKSQGQTMERLKVDMGKIFEAGQAYVALSRATSLSGLQVLNFNKRSIQAHERVAEFYDRQTTVQDLMEQESLKPKKGGKGKGIRRKKTLQAPVKE